MRRISIEEHYLTEAYLKRIGPNPEGRLLTDIGEGRINYLEKVGIDAQVLCLSGGNLPKLEINEGIKWARQVNNELGIAVKKYPRKFAGLAELPLQEPNAAAAELEKAVKEDGLKGAKIPPHVNGEYMDEKKFRVIFAKAEELGVPMYMHPSEPSPDMIKSFSAYPGLNGALYGFGAVAALGALRLILSGLFDEFPRVKIILGHMGEALPFWSWRVDNKWEKWTKPTHPLNRPPGECLKQNFYFTTSGMFSQQPLLCAYLMFGADNLMFAVDYPFESDEIAVKFMDAAPISENDKEKIYHGNAERLFGL